MEKDHRKAARAAYVAAVEAALDADAASAAAWSVAYAAWDAIAGRAHGRARAAPASTCGKLISFDCADGEVDDCAPVALLKKRVDLYGEALRDHLEAKETEAGRIGCLEDSGAATRGRVDRVADILVKHLRRDHGGAVDQEHDDWLTELECS